MSWSPDLFIGEFRPWPDTVHVVRGKTDETRRYVPEDALVHMELHECPACANVADLQDALDENARLRSCLSDDAENARMIMAENAKLRELCATVIDDWMSKVCPSFPFCEFGGEYQDCTDETCGNQIYRQMARERGIEVDDA